VRRRLPKPYRTGNVTYDGHCQIPAGETTARPCLIGPWLDPPGYSIRYQSAISCPHPSELGCCQGAANARTSARRPVSCRARSLTRFTSSLIRYGDLTISGDKAQLQGELEGGIDFQRSLVAACPVVRRCRSAFLQQELLATAEGLVDSTSILTSRAATAPPANAPPSQLTSSIPRSGPEPPVTKQAQSAWFPPVTDEDLNTENTSKYVEGVATLKPLDHQGGTAPPVKFRWVLHAISPPTPTWAASLRRCQNHPGQALRAP